MQVKTLRPLVTVDRVNTQGGPELSGDRRSEWGKEVLDSAAQGLCRRALWRQVSVGKKEI